MGLADKQALVAFREKTLPAKTKALNEVVGKTIEVEILDEAALLAAATSMIGNAFFDRFTDDVKKMCKDKTAKEAIQEGIQKIKIGYVAEAKKFTLDLAGGTLSVSGKWEGTAGTDYPTFGDYTKFLMSKL